MIDVVVLERDELAVRCRAEPHTLLGAGAMTGRLERHLAAEHELDRLAYLPRRRHRQRTMRPRPKFAAETRANKLGDDAHVLFRQTEHLREHAAHVEDPLRLLVDRQLVAVPHRGRPLQLDGIVRLGRRDVSLVELDRRAGERAGRIAALALQALRRPVAGHHLVRIILGCRARSRRSVSLSRR